MNETGGERAGRGGCDERRQKLRAAVLWIGRLECAGQVADCIVLNVGLTGAMVRMAVPFERSFAVTLHSYHFGELMSRVVWQHGNAIGLSFEDEPDRVVESLGRALPELLAA